MKVVSPLTRLNVCRFEVLCETLWRIAHREDKGELDTQWLVRNTRDMLRHADAQDKDLYWPEFQEAERAGDRAKLATLHLKLIRAHIGSEAINESLESADKRHRVGWLKSKIDDETLAVAWNAPALEDKSNRERAAHLHGVFRQKYGDNVATPSSIERRVQWMRKRGWKMPPRRPSRQMRKK
jgi:hypothetical protein